MRHRKGIMIGLTAAALAMGLTGCAENQIPDLTEEEVRAVGEYVAITMMKYDMNHRSRLMELTEVMPEASSETEEPEDTTGMRPVEDTPVVNAPEVEAAQTPTYTMEEVLELPAGMTLTFQGQTICDSYPEESDFFSLGASDGMKLLVLHFQMANTGNEEQEVNMLSQSAKFRVKVNGEYSRNALVTMMLDDLSTFEGSVPAGGSTGVVLVTELDERLAGEISALSLSVKNDSKACTIELVSP